MKWIRLSLAAIFGLSSGFFLYAAVSMLIVGVPQLTDSQNITASATAGIPYAIGFGLISYGLFRCRQWAWIPYAVLLVYHWGFIGFMVSPNIGLRSLWRFDREGILFLLGNVVIPVSILWLILGLRSWQKAQNQSGL